MKRIDHNSKRERIKEHSKNHHTQGKPQEVEELFHIVDKFCIGLDPSNVQRKYRAKTVNYYCGNNIFCCIHLRKSGLRIWLKLKYTDLENPPEYVRDVSGVGHWGAGDVELVIDSINKLEGAKILIKKSFDKNK